MKKVFLNGLRHVLDAYLFIAIALAEGLGEWRSAGNGHAKTKAAAR